MMRETGLVMVLGLVGLCLLVEMRVERADQSRCFCMRRCCCCGCCVVVQLVLNDKVFIYREGKVRIFWLRASSDLCLGLHGATGSLRTPGDQTVLASSAGTEYGSNPRMTRQGGRKG